MKFSDKTPIYLQIEQYLLHQMVTGELPAGAKVPSVRQLAADLLVNINTVQRAVSQLNERGLFESKRGMGNFVTKDENKIAMQREELVKHELQQFFGNMHALGLDQAAIVAAVNSFSVGGISDEDIRTEKRDVSARG